MGKDPRREAQIRSGPGALDSKHPTSYRHGSPLAQIPFPLELGQEGREDNRGRRRGAGWGGHRGGEVGGRPGAGRRLRGGGGGGAAVALFPRERPHHPGQLGSLRQNLVQGEHQML